MRFSQKGAKSNRKRLVRTRYFKYILEDKEYFFKEKTYLTHHDGWIETETIKKQTYINNLRKGKECIEVIVKEEIMSASLNCLGAIYSEKYGVSESYARESILKAKAIIEKIKEDSTMGISTEYELFKRIINCHMDSIKEGTEI